MKNTFIVCGLLSALLLPGTAAAQTCTNANMAESTPTSRYTFAVGGVVTDNTTSLMWKRCLEGQTFSDNGTPENYLDDTCTGSATGLNWQAALNQAQTANTANDSGHNDWRVPNLKELNSTVEYCRVSPAINTEVFPNALSSTVWSSSPVTYPGYASFASNVDFYDGGNSWDVRNYGNRVRLIRSGQ